MPTNVIMPALELAQETGKVLHWLKSPGDKVRKGEPLVEIETDKATTEIEAPVSGVLGEVTAGAGDVVPVGQTIALIFASEEAASVAPGQPSAGVNVVPAPAAAVRASPLARKIAQEHGVDLAQVKPAGGKIEKADVFAHVARQRETAAVDGTAARLAAASPKARRLATERGVDIQALRGSGPDGAIVRNADINIGLAVAIDAGLVVPIIHRADTLSLADIAARREDMVGRGQAGKLRPADIQGGGFTISNLGMYGVDAFNAIVNPPQAAILAVGRIADRVVARNGQPAVQPTMMLTLSCDHRALDGARGAQFLGALADLIEEPLALLV